jgi:hypothetical protein
LHNGDADRRLTAPPAEPVHAGHQLLFVLLVVLVIAMFWH